MNSKKLCFLAAGALLAAGTAQAAPFQAAGYITGIKTVNGNQYVDLYYDMATGDRPNCHTNEAWDFRLDRGSDPVMAELLRTAGSTGMLRLTGSGECSGNIETLKALEFRGAMPE